MNEEIGFPIQIKIEGEPLLVNTKSLKFSLHESIHSFYPTAKIDANDPTGLFQERLLFVENNKIDILFYDPDGKKSLPGVISEDDMAKTVPGTEIFGGFVNISLVHEYYRQQEKKGECYRGKVSDIINIVTSDYEFKEKIIEETLGERDFSRFNETQSEFILNELIKCGHSNESSITPFFAWIDLQNRFHFQSYQSLNSKPAKATLGLKTQKYGMYESIKKEIINITSVLSGSRYIKKYRNVVVYWRDDDGILQKEYYRNEDIPPGAKNNMKTLINKTGIENKTTSIFFNPWQKTKDPYFYFAEIANYFRGSFFPHRFLITIPITSTLSAGDKIDLDLPVMTSVDENFEKSLIHSGSYLIEDVLHYFDGINNTALTQIIVSKKFYPIPKIYPMSKKL